MAEKPDFLGFFRWKLAVARDSKNCGFSSKKKNENCVKYFIFNKEQ